MSNEFRIKVTNVFRRNKAANTRIILNQGGARSSKTYSICQYLILTALNAEKPLKFTIARKRFTWLPGTAMVDFEEVLNSMGEYSEKNHNKTKSIYTVNGCEFAFIGLDEAQKLRGRKQDYFWLNEANEADYEDFKQAISRTNIQMILDFNPSDENHWIYDYVETRPDCTFIQSTYKDNPYIDPNVRREIEMLGEMDDDYWQVFGLGNRGQSRELIYGNHSIYHELPQGATLSYGLDFGYNHPSALVECSYRDGELYWRELIYQSGLGSADLIKLMAELKIDKNRDMYADPARPEIIADIRRAGYNIKPASKHVYEDISAIKGTKLHIHSDSVNLQKEARNYKWKRHSATNLILDEPVKFMDDALDAARYGSIPIIGKKRVSPRASVISIR